MTIFKAVQPFSCILFSYTIHIQTHTNTHTYQNLNSLDFIPHGQRLAAQVYSANWVLLFVNSFLYRREMTARYLYEQPL